jgi:hypothetical protein
MSERPTIVCLCGSTKFWRTYQRAGLSETLAGRIVLSIGDATGTDDEHLGMLPQEEHERVKTMLDDLHKRKIDLADEVLILNDMLPWCDHCGVFRHQCYDCGKAFTGTAKPYIGDSTRSELAHAISRGKRVRWLNPPEAMPRWVVPEPDPEPAGEAVWLDDAARRFRAICPDGLVGLSEIKNTLRVMADLMIATKRMTYIQAEDRAVWTVVETCD